MSLEDVAKMVAPKQSYVVLKILNCFKGDKRCSFDNIQIELSNLEYNYKSETHVGVKTSSLKYYLIQLKKWRIIQGYHDPDKGYRYSIDLQGFKGKADGILFESIKNLIKVK